MNLPIACEVFMVVKIKKYVSINSYSQSNPGYIFLVYISKDILFYDTFRFHSSRSFIFQKLTIKELIKEKAYAIKGIDQCVITLNKVKELQLPQKILLILHSRILHA